MAWSGNTALSGLATKSTCWDLVSAFSTCSIPEGRGVAIVTQSGGAAALLADRAEDLGLDVPVLGADIQARLRDVIPPFGMPGNPVDLTAQFIAEPEILTKSVQIAMEDPAVHTAVIWFQLMHAFADALVDVLSELKRTVAKPFVVCWLAARLAALDRLREEGICVIGATEPAIDIIAGLVAFGETRKRLLKAPRPKLSTLPPADDSAVQPLPSMAARTLLAEVGIPLVEAEVATNAVDAGAAAERLGLPVAIKVESLDVLHKSDAGGVRLGLALRWTRSRQLPTRSSPLSLQHDSAARIDGVLVQPMAASGTELVIGMRRDPMFGPYHHAGTRWNFCRGAERRRIRTGPHPAQRCPADDRLAAG